MKTKLADKGITAYGVGADADSRLLRMMRMFLKLGHEVDDEKYKLWADFFYASTNPDIIGLQDHFHMLTKWRNRLLDLIRVMRIGRHKITVSSLKVGSEIQLIFIDSLFKYLCCCFQALRIDAPEIIGSLNKRDVDPDDRMNVESAKHFFSDKVLELIDDPGTLCFVKLMKMYMDAWDNSNISIRDRIMKVT